MNTVIEAPLMTTTNKIRKIRKDIKLTPEKLEERRKEFDVVKSVAKAKREDVGA